MRLITTRELWRAFPELDHFSDEQCRGFVAAANRSGAARTARFLWQLLIAVVSCGATFFTLYTLTESLMRVDRDTNDVIAVAVMLGVCIASFGTLAFVFLLARDVLLRRRIRHIMGTRGSCTECGYGLTGLPVTERTEGATQHAVMCPECGTLHDADAKFNEVVIDANGTARYVPSPDAAARMKPRVSLRERWRKIRRPLLIGLGVLALLVGTPLVVYEGFLRWQAHRAALNMLDQSDLDDAVAKAYPDLPPAGSGGVDVWANASGLANEMARLRQASTESGTRLSAMEYDFIQMLEEDPDLDLARQATHVEAGIHARRAYDEVVERGLLGELDALAAMPVQRARLELVEGHAGLLQVYTKSIQDYVELGYVNRARMRIAIASGDLGEFRQALTTQIGLERQAAAIPLMWNIVFTRGSHVATMKHATHALSRHRTREWLEAVEAEFASPPAWASELVLDDFVAMDARNMLAQIYADPGNVRLGMYSTFFRDLRRYRTDTQLVGSYSGAVDQYETIQQQMRPMLLLDPWQQVRPGTSVDGGYAALFYTTQSYQYQFRSGQHLNPERAFRFMLAVERFRFEKERLPKSLDELVPMYIESIPRDAHVNQPLRFAPLASPSGSIVDGYTIYAAGQNGSDDGGQIIPGINAMGRFASFVLDDAVIVMPTMLLQELLEAERKKAAFTPSDNDTNTPPTGDISETPDAGSQ